MGVLQNLSTELQKRSVALIVIDSIAMLARIEMTQYDIPKRQRMLAQQAGLLKRAAEQFNLTVVTTNQVTAGFGDGTGQRAALGVLWSHCVNSRLVLEQQHGIRCIRVRHPLLNVGHCASYYSYMKEYLLALGQKQQFHRAHKSCSVELSCCLFGVLG